MNWKWHAGCSSERPLPIVHASKLPSPDKLALLVAQSWMLLSESNDGVEGMPKLLSVYSHPPLSHSRSSA